MQNACGAAGGRGREWFRTVKAKKPTTAFLGNGKRRARAGRPAGRARSAAAAGRQRFVVRHILVPVDFTERSRKAIRFAEPLARHFGARISLLTVVPGKDCPADYGYGPVSSVADDGLMARRAEARLKAFARSEVSRRLLGEVLVRQGTPFDEITRAASRLNADFIVMTTRGSSGGADAWLDSTAERVVRHAPCPVLVVREREHRFV